MRLIHDIIITPRVPFITYIYIATTKQHSPHEYYFTGNYCSIKTNKETSKELGR